MREPTERELQYAILGYLNYKLRHFAWENPSAGYFDTKTKVFRRHTSPYVLNGTPDIYCLIRNIPELKGVIVGFEVKSKSGKQSTSQQAFEYQMKKAGGYYFVVRSIEDAERALNSISSTS